MEAARYCLEIKIEDIEDSVWCVCVRACVRACVCVCVVCELKDENQLVTCMIFL